MDFRLQKYLVDFLNSHGLNGDYDLISVGGASKALVSPKDPRDKEFLLDQIDISVSLHHANKIMIFHHEDCGAYGGSGAFDSIEKEREQHIFDMKKSKEALFCE